MGSVTNYIECPRCKQPDCVDDFNYKSGETYIFCPSCGYNVSMHYKRDEEGKLLKIDPEKGHEFSNLIPEELCLDNPYGAFYVESIKGGGTMGTLNTEEDYQKFVSEIVSLTNQENEINVVTVSRLVGETIEKETLYQREI